VGTRPAHGLFDVLERAAKLSWALGEKGTLPLILYAKKDELTSQGTQPEHPCPWGGAGGA